MSSRRTVLALGLASAAAAAAAAVTGLELISRGILPGKSMLDTLDGACSVPAPALEFAPPGPSFSRTFYSAARRRTVGYTIAYPPGHRAGSELPLVVMLHGYGGNHADALVGMSPAQAVALQVDGRPLAPMALVTVDGGNGYWNPHPDDDPMAMVIGELIPLCFFAEQQPPSLAFLARQLASLGAGQLSSRSAAASFGRSPAMSTSSITARSRSGSAASAVIRSWPARSASIRSSSSSTTSTFARYSRSNSAVAPASAGGSLVPAVGDVVAAAVLSVTSLVADQPPQRHADASAGEHFGHRP